MSNDHASMFKKRMTCPNCSDRSESSLDADFHCPLCGRRKSQLVELLLNSPPYQGVPLTKRNVLECDNKQDEDEYAIHDLNIRLADMTERCEAHKANYEYMAKRCAEQQKEIEASNAALGYARDNIAALKAEVERLTMQYKQATQSR